MLITVGQRLGSLIVGRETRTLDNSIYRITTYNLAIISPPPSFRFYPLLRFYRRCIHTQGRTYPFTSFYGVISRVVHTIWPDATHSQRLAQHPQLSKTATGNLLHDFISGLFLTSDQYHLFSIQCVF